jgi:hypothetical protein
MEERAMANREQKSNREKKKPKKDKPKGCACGFIWRAIQTEQQGEVKRRCR